MPGLLLEITHPRESESTLVGRCGLVDRLRQVDSDVDVRSLVVGQVGDGTC